MKNHIIQFIAIISIVIFARCTPDTHWPQFLGPGGNNISEETNLPMEWNKNKNLIWKYKVPGKGWSSPVVWGDKVFITTAYKDKEDAKPKDDENGGSAQDNRRIQPNVDYRFEIYCLNKNTGEELWVETAYLGKPGIITHRDNTYASETPVTDGKYLYVYFGMRGLYCYDLDGKKIWEKNIGIYPMQANWGTSSSPILYKDYLILQFDNEENSQVIALDKKTGDQIWKAERDEISTWSTPYIWKNNQRTELVTGGKKTRSYNPETGELLWQLDMQGGRDISTPTSNAEMIFICNEERSDGGGILMAVKAGASGDISLDSAEISNESVAWILPKCGIAMASPVLSNGYLYALERRRGLVSCIDIATGKFVYRKEKLEGAKAFWASPWTYDDMIFCLDDTGTTHVLQSGKEFKVLHANKLSDRFWSSTAVSSDMLIFRGVNGIYGVGN